MRVDVVAHSKCVSGSFIYICWGNERKTRWEKLTLEQFFASLNLEPNYMPPAKRSRINEEDHEEDDDDEEEEEEFCAQNSCSGDYDYDDYD